MYVLSVHCGYDVLQYMCTCVCVMLVSMLQCILHCLYDTQQVYNLLRNQGHNVVAVFTVPDDAQTGRADPLAEQAAKDGMPVLKYNRWRQKKAPIPEVSVPSPSLTVSLSQSLPHLPQVLEEYKSFNADLNVLPFCTQFIPMEVINHPKHGSIIYHPSILPIHRGASAINWWVNPVIKCMERHIIICTCTYGGGFDVLQLVGAS